MGAGVGVGERYCMRKVCGCKVLVWGMGVRCDCGCGCGGGGQYEFDFVGVGDTAGCGRAIMRE